MSDKVWLSEAEDWIELFPYGVIFDSEGFASPQRPVMFFKNKDESQILPVWLSSLDAGIAIFQQERQEGISSPHDLAWKALKSLDIKLERCFFVEVKGYHQYVELHFSGSDKLKKLRSRTDEAISFCLSTDTKFYCKSEFIDRCRVVDAEISRHQPLGERSLDRMDRPTYLN